MEQIKIEKGVPMEKMRICIRDRYPFAKMDVGDSFHIKNIKDRKKANISATLLASAKYYVLKNRLTWKFATRYTPTGVRIWRIQ